MISKVLELRRAERPEDQFFPLVSEGIVDETFGNTRSLFGEVPGFSAINGNEFDFARRV